MGADTLPKDHLTTVTALCRLDRRPRFTLLTYMALLDLAGSETLLQVSRGEIARTVESWLPAASTRFQKRHEGRVERIKLVKAEAQIHREAGFGGVAALVEEGIGDPTGTNVSRSLTFLQKTELIAVQYIDKDGDLHPKPARGRMLHITLTGLQRSLGLSETSRVTNETDHPGPQASPDGIQIDLEDLLKAIQQELS